MGHFVKGIVESNEPGAVYQGNVYDRDLTLLHSSGQRLKIFNDSWDIDDKLTIGEEYELILCQAVVIKIQTTPFEAEDIHHWSGRLVNLDWKPVSGGYRLVDAELYTDSWLLVETIFGNMIMPRSALTIKQQSELQVGQAIWWKARRLDLYAAI